MLAASGIGEQRMNLFVRGLLRHHGRASTDWFANGEPSPRTFARAARPIFASVLAMSLERTWVTSTQPGPEHKPDEPMPDAPAPEELPTTEPKHYPIHREIPEQPIHEPLPDRPRA